MSPTPQAPLISIERVTKRFPGVVALDGVSFDVRPGEFHAVVGENGAGKSTLMKILSGVISDFEGRILLRGDPVRFADTRAAEQAGVSIIHQELNLVEDLSAAANVFLGRELKTAFGLLDDRAMRREAAAFFEQLECHIPPGEPVRRLRVGDQQLVEIAKALSRRTEILIMDEPTSALTETEVERLFRVIERLRQRGAGGSAPVSGGVVSGGVVNESVTSHHSPITTHHSPKCLPHDGVTILYISHKLDEVFRLSDRITVLRDGKLVKTLNRRETTPREVTHLMVGREIEETRLGEERRPGDVVLAVENLSLPWPGHARQWRLRNVNFSLRRGEVLGIAGLMGAGRTELLECLFGASPEPPQGRIVLDGREVAFTNPSEACEAGLALVTEDRKRLGLFDHMTVRDNITLCTLSEAAAAGLISSKAERRMAGESIAQLSIRTAGSEGPIKGLSGGNQQKCIIARWLRTRPKVLLLDDPTRGVDVGAKAELYKIIDRLCREGLGIIVTSSELPELITLCDRILVLCEGRLTAEFPRSDFREETIMEAATSRPGGGA